VSDDLTRQQRQLEQATAAEQPADAPPLDEQAAALREGWLALGHLLEAAQPPPERPVDLSRVVCRRIETRRVVAIVATLAASVLVVATVAWSLMRGGSPDDSSAPLPEIAASPEEPTPQLPPTPKLPTPDPSAVVQTPPTPEVPQEPIPDPIELDELGWDDPLDNEIAMVGQAVINIQQDWYHLGDPYGPVQSALSEMEEDIEGDDDPL